MRLLNKIKSNCNKATFLIEKKLLNSLSFRERIELQIHLVSCSVCRLYQVQSGKISELVRQLFQDKSDSDLTLDDSFKKGLQDRIEKELNN